MRLAVIVQWVEAIGSKSMHRDRNNAQVCWDGEHYAHE